MKLAWNRSFGTGICCQLKTPFKFAFVGATGTAVNLFLLWSLTRFGSLYYMYSAIIAIEASILWNFYFNSRMTFEYAFCGKNNLIISIFKYHFASLIGMLVNISALFLLTEYFKISYLISEFIAILLAFGLNYFISKNLVWNRNR